jgi:hypothetical protein
VVNLIILISKNGEKVIKNQKYFFFFFSLSQKKIKIAKTKPLLTRHRGQVF